MKRQRSGFGARFVNKLARIRQKKNPMYLHNVRYQRYKPYKAFLSAAKKRYPNISAERAFGNVAQYYFTGIPKLYRKSFNYVKAVQKRKASQFRAKRAAKTLRTAFQRWRGARGGRAM